MSLSAREALAELCDYINDEGPSLQAYERARAALSLLHDEVLEKLADVEAETPSENPWNETWEAAEARWLDAVLDSESGMRHHAARMLKRRLSELHDAIQREAAATPERFAWFDGLDAASIEVHPVGEGGVQFSACHRGDVHTTVNVQVTAEVARFDGRMARRANEGSCMTPYGRRPPLQGSSVRGQRRVLICLIADDVKAQGNRARARREAGDAIDEAESDRDYDEPRGVTCKACGTPVCWSSTRALGPCDEHPEHRLIKRADGSHVYACSLVCQRALGVVLPPIDLRWMTSATWEGNVVWPLLHRLRDAARREQRRVPPLDECVAALDRFQWDGDRADAFLRRGNERGNAHGGEHA